MWLKWYGLFIIIIGKSGFWPYYRINYIMNRMRRQWESEQCKNHKKTPGESMMDRKIIDTGLIITLNSVKIKMLNFLVLIN